MLQATAAVRKCGYPGFCWAPEAEAGQCLSIEAPSFAASHSAVGSEVNSRGFDEAIVRHAVVSSGAGRVKEVTAVAVEQSCFKRKKNPKVSKFPDSF